MKIKPELCPPGTRFLYRTLGSLKVLEDVVLEWAPSGLFVRCRDVGWQSLESFSYFNFLETLAPLRDPVPATTSRCEEDLDPEMCPNCVTPWKCNGPHKFRKKDMIDEGN